MLGGRNGWPRVLCTARVYVFIVLIWTSPGIRAPLSAECLHTEQVPSRCLNAVSLRRDPALSITPSTTYWSTLSTAISGLSFLMSDTSLQMCPTRHIHKLAHVSFYARPPSPGFRAKQGRTWRCGLGLLALLSDGAISRLRIVNIAAVKLSRHRRINECSRQTRQSVLESLDPA